MQVISNDAVNAAPRYNEAEIRFHIIDPIIRILGYPGEDNVYLNLEEKLEYPYLHIGRRSKKDLPLGFPDYRAGLKGARGSFITEAKAGNIPITSREVEQAHSYAAHAQVGANYFVLFNGSAVYVYETLSGSTAAPLAQIPLSELNERFYELENILAPASLAKNCQVKHDTKLKLADGLGSSVKIRSGHYLMSDYEYRIMVNGQDCTELLRQSVPQFAIMDQQLELLKTSFELRVSGGFAERGTDGRITAHVEFTGATVHNHQAMAIMVSLKLLSAPPTSSFQSTRIAPLYSSR
ncbi:MAG: type I restriction enzyme HsdR N-terminal domain-containing protein [Hoeflea sp.]|nr:type I restriction enzyme HsdR N-terminal domain-containing protein [Hoeflea sp.]